MNLSRYFSAAAAVMMMFTMTACNDDKGGSTEEKKNYSSAATEAAVTEATEPVVAAKDGPRLFINDVKAKAGEVAEVTISIENAEEKWNMCGFHITYPDILKPVVAMKEDNIVKNKLGPASEFNNGSVAMEWVNNKTEYLTSNKLGSIFFTEIFNANYGLDGDVVTFYFEIPDDAESGTEYPVDFMYIEGDVFSNMEQDKSMEKYVFENWKGGKIIVE